MNNIRPTPNPIQTKPANFTRPHLHHPNTSINHPAKEKKLVNCIPRKPSQRKKQQIRKPLTTTVPRNRSLNHRNTIVYVNWYPYCWFLLLKSDLVEGTGGGEVFLTQVKEISLALFATCCGCFDSVIPVPALRRAKPNYSLVNQQSTTRIHLNISYQLSSSHLTWL